MTWVEERLARRSVPVRVGLVALATYVLLTAVLSTVGLLLVGLGTDRAIGDFDEASTLWFEQRRFGVADAVASNLSNLSDTFTVLGVLFGASVLLLALRRWRELTVLGVAIAVEFTVFLTVNTIVGRPRPAVEPLESVPSTSSFPSGHIAAAIALYGAMAWIVREVSGSDRAHRRLVSATVLVAAGVGGSRVYLGLHHPIDVLAGAVLGVAALAGAVRAASMIPTSVRPRPRPRPRWLAAVEPPEVDRSR